MSNVWQAAWRITTEILKVKGLTSQLANKATPRSLSYPAPPSIKESNPVPFKGSPPFQWPLRYHLCHDHEKEIFHM